MSATVPIVSELVVNGAVRATISDRSTISGAHPGGHYSVDMTRNNELSLGGLYTSLTTAKRTTTRRLCLVPTDNYHWRTPAPLAVAKEPAGSPNGIGVGFDKARMRINAMANDRQLDALEQEVARAKKLIQQQVKKPEHKPFKPAETYEALLAQARALDQLERNTRKMLQHYQQRDAAQEREKLLVSEGAMNSEREANQRLTEVVERLEEELEQFRELVVEAQKAKVFRESLKGATKEERIVVGSDARDWYDSIVNKLAGEEC